MGDPITSQGMQAILDGQPDAPPAGEETRLGMMLRGARVAEPEPKQTRLNALLGGPEQYSVGQYAVEVLAAPARGLAETVPALTEAAAIVGSIGGNLVMAGPNALRAVQGKPGLGWVKPEYSSWADYAAKQREWIEHIGTPGIKDVNPAATLIYGALEMVGATVPYLLGGEAIGGLRTASAVMGAQSGARAYFAADAAGAPEHQKWADFLLHGGVGAAQAAALGPMFERWDKASGGWLRKVVVEGSIMGGSSAAAQVATNAIARSFDKEDRNLLEGVIQAGGVGAVGGALLSSIKVLAGEPARRGEEARRKWLQDLVDRSKIAEEAFHVEQQAAALRPPAQETPAAQAQRIAEWEAAMRERGVTEDEILSERRRIEREPVVSMIEGRDAALHPPELLALARDQDLADARWNARSLAEREAAAKAPPHPLRGAPSPEIETMLRANLEHEAQQAEDVLGAAGRTPDEITNFLSWLDDARGGGPQARQGEEAIDRVLQSLNPEMRVRMQSDPGTGYTTEELIDALRASVWRDKGPRVMPKTIGGSGRAGPRRAAPPELQAAADAQFEGQEVARWKAVGAGKRNLLWGRPTSAPVYVPESAHTPDLPTEAKKVEALAPEATPAPAPSGNTGFPAGTAGKAPGRAPDVTGSAPESAPAKPAPTLLERLRGTKGKHDEALLDDLRGPFQKVLEALPDDAGTTPDEVAGAIARTVDESMQAHGNKAMSSRDLATLKSYAKKWFNELVPQESADPSERAHQEQLKKLEVEDLGEKLKQEFANSKDKERTTAERAAARANVKTLQAKIDALGGSGKRTRNLAKDVKGRALSGQLGFRAYVAALGGLKSSGFPEAGEARMFTVAEGGKEMQFFGVGPVARGPGSKGGLDFDQVGQLAHEAGWFPGKESGHVLVDDVIDALHRNAHHPDQNERVYGEMEKAHYAEIDIREQHFKEDDPEGYAKWVAEGRPQSAQLSVFDLPPELTAAEHIEMSREFTEEAGFPWEAQVEEPTQVSPDQSRAKITGELDSPDDVPSGFARSRPLDPMAAETTAFEGQVEISRGLIGFVDPPPGYDKAKPLSALDVIKSASLIPVGAGLDAVPIKQGLLGQAYKHALGRYKQFARMVRIQRRGDIVSALHEVGHDLEVQFFGFKGGGDLQHPLTSLPLRNPTADAVIRTELQRMGQRSSPGGEPSNGYMSEGWAEFFAQFVAQPEVAAKFAPETLRWFNDFLETKPLLAKYVGQTQALARRWRFQGTAARAKYALRNPDAINERLIRLSASFNAGALEQDFLSVLSPLRQVMNDAKGTSDKAYQLASQTRTLAHALSQNADGVYEHMVKDGTVNMWGQRTGGSLDDIAKQVRGKAPEFSLFLFAKRTEALMEPPQKLDRAGNPVFTKSGKPVPKKPPRETPMFIDEAKRIIEAHPEFEKPAAELYDWWRRINDYCSQASDSYKHWLEQTEEGDVGNFVPMHAIYDEFYSRWVGAGKPSTFGGLVKTYRGTEGGSIVDPLKAIGAEANARIRKAHREAVSDHLAQLAKTMPGMGRWVEDVTDSIKKQVPLGTKHIDDLIRQINAVLHEKGAKMIQSPTGGGEFTGTGPVDLAAETLTIFGQTYQMPDGKYIVPRFEREASGKMDVRYYQYDPDLYHALHGIDPARLPQLEGLWQTLVVTVPNFTFKLAAVTRLHFALIKNPARDIVNAYQNARTDMGMARLLWEVGKLRVLTALDSGNRTLSDVGRSFGFDIPTKSWHWAIDLYRSTGLESNRMIGTPTERAHKLIGTTFGSRKVWSVVGAGELIGKMWRGYLDMLNTSEAAPRMAEMKAALREKGITDGNLRQTDLNTLHDAMWKSKTVTTDYTDTGFLLRKANAWAPFLGPSVQGPRDNIRAMLRNPAKFMVRWAASTAIPYTIYWWMVKDEDWYKGATASAKAEAIFVPVEKSNGEKGLLAIPKAQFVGSVMGSAWEFALDAAWGSGDPQIREEIQSLVRNMLPGVPMPAVYREGIEQVANKDFYSGKPIESESGKVPPYTGRMARTISAASGVSAQRIEHAMRGMTGGFANEMLDLIGQGNPMIGTGGSLSDLPVVGKSFVRGGQFSTTQSRYIQDLYDLNDAALALHGGGGEKTEDQRQIRLMLNDAVRAIGQARLVSQHATMPLDRQAIDKEMLDIAREAVQFASSGKYDRARAHAAAGRYGMQRERLGL